MRKLLELLDLHRLTIARDLTFGLLAVITCVFATAGTINYFYTVDRDTRALQEKASETADSLASVLATPMWNLNTDELQKIVDIYRQSGVVADIHLVDDVGGELVPFSHHLTHAKLELTRIITHDKTSIGRVTVQFDDRESAVKQLHILAYSLAVFTLLTIAVIIALTMLLRRTLKQPLTRLAEGLTVISHGHYHHEFAPVRQVDINDITEKVTKMAREIAKREAAIELNRAKLETLNQAILDLFSCSDTGSLIRQTMTLAFKVCGVDHGWFLAQSNPLDDQKDVLPVPLVSVRGQVFEATIREVQVHIGKQDDFRTFTFDIKSREGKIGTMTFSFAQVPDTSVTALMRSLMSLTSLALIRQSFIRETAFIAAELQVAEAVQRSMLIDDAKRPRNAEVAYHYEPVLRVGGDWFSVTEAFDGSVFVIMGDVTGHGLAQGLITTAMAGAMTIIESLIRDFDDTSIKSPSEILTQLNNVMRKLVGKSNLRMTCVAAQIDFKHNRLVVCNAGHTFPLVLRQKSGEKSKVEALARNQQYMLGDDSSPAVIAHVYSDAVYSLQAEDLLLFYTDGLTEATGKDGRAFVRTFHRHVNKITSSRGVGELCEEILTLFKNHTLDVPVKDDICLVVVGKKPDASQQVA